MAGSTKEELSSLTMRTICCGSLDGADVGNGAGGVLERECILRADAPPRNGGRHIGRAGNLLELHLSCVAIRACTPHMQTQKQRKLSRNFAGKSLINVTGWWC